MRKATYHLTISGEIDLNVRDENAKVETIDDLANVVRESFPTDLQAGVTINFKDVSIRYDE